MLNIFGLILIISAFVNAITQVLLKNSAEETKGKSFINKLLNKKVFISYLIFVILIFVNLYAFRGVDYKYGGVINAFGQVFVMVLAYFFCGEKLTKNRVTGCILVIVGIIVYSLQ